MKLLWNVYRFFFFLLLPFAVAFIPVFLCIYFDTEAFAWGMILSVPACVAMCPGCWEKACDYITTDIEAE